MRQALVIFRKDVKHLWPYGAAMVTLLVFHGWIDFQMHRSYLGVLNMGMPAPLEPFLAFLAWWCLAGLVMQQERVPGSRQYWLTRPVSRESLLAAKALFLITFFCLPDFLAQTIVLGVAGFSPVAWLGSLAWNQVLIAMDVIAAAALASVTANFRQYILTSAAIFAIATFELSSNNGNQWGGVQWAGEAAMQFVLLLSGIVILALQYSHRRTGLARLVVAAGFIAVLLLLTPAGWHQAFALTSAIATRESAAPVAIALDTAMKPYVTISGTEPVAFTPTSYRVAVPVRITGIPPGRELISERASAVVEASGVPKWDSGWSLMNQIAPRGEWSSADEWLPHDGTYWLSFKIPGDYYRSVKDKPASLRLAVALTMVTSPTTTDLPPNPRMYPVPDVGHCSADVVRGHPMFSCVTPFVRTVAVDYHVQPANGGLPWRADGCCIQSYGPFNTVGKLSVWADTGLMPTGPQFLAAGARISVEVRRPVAFFQREISIAGMKLDQYGPRLESGRR